MLQRTKFPKLKWNAYLLCHRLPEFNGETLPSIICRLHVERRSHHYPNNQAAGRCTRILRKCTLRAKQESPEQYHSASYYRESFVVGLHDGNILFGVLAWPYEVVPLLRPREDYPAYSFFGFAARAAFCFSSSWIKASAAAAPAWRIF